MRVPLVLVVEDDPELRKLICKHLESLGLEINQAATGKAALDALDKTTPALVCLDLMLPEQSGYSVCERMRRELRLLHVPVLVISARALPEDRAAAEEAGASAYLVKPFTRKQLMGQVEALIGPLLKR